MAIPKLSGVPAISVKQMQKVDHIMIQDYRITLVQMMENAGRHLADLARQLLGGSIVNKNITVVAGSGNNGGGGLVAARYLSNFGAEVTVLLGTPERKLKAIPLLRWQTIDKLPVKSIADADEFPQYLFKEAHLIVDAVIGYGLNSEPKGKAATVIDMILASENPRVLSLDIPSGLNGDSGMAATCCVKASATMTLALPKTGLLKPTAKPYVGDLYLADIGVPPSLYSKINLSDQNLFMDGHIIQLVD